MFCVVLMEGGNLLAIASGMGDNMIRRQLSHVSLIMSIPINGMMKIVMTDVSLLLQKIQIQDSLVETLAIIQFAMSRSKKSLKKN